MNRQQNQNFRRWLALSRIWMAKQDGLSFEDSLSRVAKKFSRQVSEPGFEAAAREAYEGSEVPNYGPVPAPGAMGDGKTATVPRVA